MSNEKIEAAFNKKYPNAHKNNLGFVIYEAGWQAALAQQPAHVVARMFNPETHMIVRKHEWKDGKPTDLGEYVCCGGYTPCRGECAIWESSPNPETKTRSLQKPAQARYEPVAIVRGVASGLPKFGYEIRAVCELEDDENLYSEDAISALQAENAYLKDQIAAKNTVYKQVSDLTETLNRKNWLIRQVLDSLPMKRDWLNPDYEAEMKESK